MRRKGLGREVTTIGGVVGDKTDRLTGQLKEKAGSATGDAGLEQKGQDEQAKGNLKSSAKKAKEAVKKSV